MAMTVKQLVQVLGDMEVCYYGPIPVEFGVPSTCGNHAIGTPALE